MASRESRLLIIRSIVGPRPRIPEARKPGADILLNSDETQYTPTDEQSRPKI
jgi:hypothetical protein